MNRERERGVMLRKIDSGALGRKALAHLTAMYPETEWVAARFQYDYAVFLRGDEAPYALCSEGVGWEVEWHKPLSLDVIASWKDKDGQVHGSIVAGAVVYLSPVEVKRLAEESTEDVDLADFVREFGDRLEANFSLWHSRLVSR